MKREAISNPFSSLVGYDFKKGATSGRRHKKVLHLRGPDPVNGSTLCRLPRRKSNSPNLVVPLYADNVEGVTCMKCIKAIEIGNKSMM